MKLKLIKKEDRRKNIHPKMSLKRTGSFYLNKEALSLLKVVENNLSINFYQDECNPQAWFICPDKKGDCVLKYNATKYAGEIYASNVAKKIADSFYHIGNQTLKFYIEKPIKFNDQFFYPLKVIKESINMDIPNPNGPLPRK